MKLFQFLLTISFFFSFLFFPLRASADSKKQRVKAAKKAFKAGQSLFGAEEYRKAAQKFIKAYEYRKIAAFLFNTAVCFEKIEEFEKAKDYFVKYLEEEKDPKGLPAIQARIRLLNKLIKFRKNKLKEKLQKEKELKEKKEAEKKNENKGEIKDKQKPDKKNKSKKEIKNKNSKNAKEKSKETDDAKEKKEKSNKDPGNKEKKIVLPPIKTKNLITISTNPPNATLYLDTLKNKLGKTPYQGTISKGKHVLILKIKGFKPMKKEITISGNRTMEFYFDLKKNAKLAWTQITSTPSGASIYIDKKEIGPIGKTPYNGFIAKGKHTVYVEKSGYKTQKQIVNFVPGNANNAVFKLTNKPVAFLTIFGKKVNKANIKINGKTICVAPCVKVEIPSGKNKLTIQKSGYKTVQKNINFKSGSHYNYSVKLAKSPSKSGAITAYIVGLASLGAGIWLGNKSEEIKEEYENDLADGIPVYSNDKRLTDGKIYAISANVVLGISALSFVVAIIRTFSSSGPESKIIQTVQMGNTDLAVTPLFGPNQAGVSLSFSY
ncbi:MAG: PEGA domain-containing protein [Myxococcota bacterium]